VKILGIPVAQVLHRFCRTLGCVQKPFALRVLTNADEDFMKVLG
jgi:hypothetical protein